MRNSYRMSKMALEKTVEQQTASTRSNEFTKFQNKKLELTFLLFVDLSAAFDHIPQRLLFESIKLRFPNRSIPRTFEILKTLYKNTTLTYDDAVISFKTSSGVRQGGPGSPFLFNLYLDFVMRVFIQKCKNDNQIKFLQTQMSSEPTSIFSLGKVKNEKG